MPQTKAAFVDLKKKVVALPAALVALGARAALSTLISAVPDLVWVRKNKEAVFVFAGVMLTVSGCLQWRSRFAPCPVDAAQCSAVQCMPA